MAGLTLGTGDYAASIYTRDGKSELLPLDGTSGIEWGRVQNGYSEASVTVQAALARECWSDLGRVHAWAHTLVLFRNDERVWEGPIVTEALTSRRVRFDARDVSSWLTRRRIRTARTLSKNEPARFVLDEAELSIQAAFALDDPNVLPYLTVVWPDDPDDVPGTRRDLKRNQGYHYDDLTALCDEGVNFTVVGRRIVVWSDGVTLGHTDTLVPERDTLNEVELVESGLDLITRATAANEKAAASVWTSDGGSYGVTPFYGLHDMIVDNRGRKKAAGLETIAGRAIGRSYPTPVRVTFPQDAQLDCAAPLPISALVPGTLVPVESSATPRDVSATFVLDSIKVTVDENGREAVAVSLSPAVGA